MKARKTVWLLRPEAAEYLGVSFSGLAHMACNGTGPRYFRAGKRVRYHIQDLDEWVQATCPELLPHDLQRFKKEQGTLHRRYRNQDLPRP